MVGVTDGSYLLRAGRVVMPLAVVLALLWSSSSVQPGMTDAPPAPPDVRPTLTLQHGILGHHLHLGQPAARQGQRHRRDPMPVAVLAAVLAGAVVATARPERVAHSRRLTVGWHPLWPRAPPLLAALT